MRLLMNKSPKDHIDSILAGSTYNRFGKMSANILSRDIDTAFEGGDKFIYELLQNADDSSENQQAVDVKFQLFTLQKQQYLLFSHNGKHFSKQDVNRITDYANQDATDTSSNSEHAKGKDSEKIGYKGVGFKAVFTVATCVIIFSKDYRFRFDSDSKLSVNWPDDKPYPWQVIPIWTETDFLPAETRKSMEENRVNFLFKISTGIKIEESLDFILKNTQMLLFLRHVNKITLTGLKLNPIVVSISKEANGFCQIQNSATAKDNSTWLIKSFTTRIDKNISAELQNLSAHACPDRLKNALQTKISFAAKINNNRLEPLISAKIFCYLPTQVRTNMPYLINADFLLDPPRANLLDNKWNRYLFEEIARYQFSFLVELTKMNDFRMQILNLLSEAKLTGAPEKCAKHFEDSFHDASARIAFIPSNKTNHLLRVDEAAIDETGFYRKFKGLDLPDSQRSLVNTELENQNKLHQFRIQHINFDVLLTQLKFHATNKPIDFHVELISYLFTNRKFLNANKLRKTMFILDTNDNLTSPELAHFKPEEDISQFPGIEKVAFIHDELNKRLNSKDLKSWLKELGVEKANALQLFRGHIVRLIENSGLTQENVIGYTRFIFSLAHDNKLKENDYLILKKLPILKRNGELVAPALAYLRDDHKPTTPLQPALATSTIKATTGILISVKYPVQQPGSEDFAEEAENWGRFFKSIGVNEDVTFIREDVFIGEAKKKIWNFSQYLSFLKSKGEASSQTYDTQRINNLVYSPMMFLISDPATTNVFFQRLSAHWHVINHGRTMSYQLSRSATTITLSYIQYVAQTTPCLMGNDEERHKTIELYSQEFSALSNYDKSIVTINLAINLSDEILRYLGVNYALNYDKCLMLLKKLSIAKDVEMQCFAIVWKQLLALELTDRQETELLNSLTIKFPNQLNGLSSKNDLSFFALSEQNTPMANNWLKRFPDFSFDQMHQLATLFGIKIYDGQDHQLDFGKKDPIIDVDTPKLFFSTISNQSPWTYLGIITFLESRSRGENPASSWTKISQAFMQIQFIQVDELSCRYGIHNSAPVFFHVYLEKLTIYYKRQWKNHKRIEDFSKALGTHLKLSNDTISKLQRIFLMKEKEFIKVLTAWLLPEIPPFLQTPPEKPQFTPSSPAPSPVENLSTQKKPTPQDTSTPKSKSAIDPEFFDKQSDSPSTKIKSPETTPTMPHKASAASTPSKPRIKLVNPAGFDYTLLKKIPDATFSVKNPPTSSKKVSLNLIPATEKSHSKAAHAKPNATDSTEEANEFSDQTNFFEKSTKPQLSAQDKNLIGRCGEELIYRQLRAKYQAKYPQGTYTEFANGFEITLTPDSTEASIKVIWHNKDAKRDEDRDITVIKPPNKYDSDTTAKSVLRFIEVKATTTAKQSFNLTARELKLAKAEGNRYKLIHISNIDTEAPSFIKIRNPAEKLDKELTIEAYKICF